MEYRFANCLVDLRTREVRLGGIVQEVPRRVFDVLAYLIQHRDRVVSQKELLDKIWLGRIVSANVFSRTVVMARQCVGDTRRQPSIIRTVQRVGYRFVAPIVELAGASQALIGAHRLTADPPIALRIGFLPFTNLTGEAQLAWVELGLLSLVVQSLNADKRLSVPSTASVLMCMNNLRGATTQRAKAKRLMLLLGVKVVISASISKSADQFVVSFRSFGRGIDDFEGRLCGPELTQLGLQLGQHVERSLLPVGTPGRGAKAHDRFVNECFSRGMQASDERRWLAASKFLAIACMFEPSTITARLQYIYVLARLADPSAAERAAALVSEARALGDPVAEARATYVQALALAESSCDLDLARVAVQRSIELAERTIGEEWRIRAYLLKFYLAYVQKDIQTCELAIEEAQRACEEDGDQLAMLAVLNNRAALQSSLGDVGAAYTTTKKAIALSGEFQLLAMQPVAMANLAILEFDLGMFDAFFRSAASFFDLLEALEDRPYIQLRYAMTRLFLGASELRATDAMLEWKSRFAAKTHAPETPVFAALDVFRDALIEQSQGALDGACLLLEQATQLLNDGKHYHEVANFLAMLTLNMLRLGRLAEAKRQRQTIVSYREFSADPLTRLAIHYVDALHAWLSGDRSTCLRVLRVGLMNAFPSVWQSYMRFDLAWLLLRDGCVAEAESVLRPIATWLDHHPAGLVVGALLADAKGDRALAHERHARHLQLVGGQAMTHFGEWREYDRAGHTGLASSLEVADALPSIYLVAC